jgi:hypothetical protein
MSDADIRYTKAPLTAATAARSAYPEVLVNAEILYRYAALNTFHTTSTYRHTNSPSIHCATRAM